ncbi:MAG: hypothetical protein NEA02_08880 [Thermoanaerobaculia bacterium]|nr:hypothetical protein [Thermoanaerobaculia bacterium]
MRPRYLPSLLVVALLLPVFGCGMLGGLRSGGDSKARVLVELAPDSSTLFVPVILSSSGLQDAFFTSEMVLTNRGTTQASIAYTYVASNGGGSGSGNDTLAPGEQRVIPDAISYLRSRGVPIPDSGNRVGTLRVAFTGLSSASAGAVTVRTTTPVPPTAPTGRAGLAYAGVAAPQLLTGTAYLCGLRENAFDRTNVAIQNAGDADVRIRLTFLAGDGSSATGSVEDTLSPGGFKQYRLPDIASGAANGFVRAERVSGTGTYYAYAVINDNVTSDGSFVTPLVESSLLNRAGLTLPVVVETSSFSTEVILTNFSTVAKQVTLAYVSDTVSTADRTASYTVTLAPGEQRILPAYVQLLRDNGALGIGPAGPTYTGSLFATVAGGDVGGLFLGARTSNPGGGGRYGLFYASRPFGTAVTTEAWLYGLQQNAENRTNLALISTGEVDSNPITLRIEIFDGANGSKVATVEGDPTTTLARRGFKQIGTILNQYAGGVSQAYARVTRTSGQNGFIVYAVVNDGGNPGERSGDGAFVALDTQTAVNATFSGAWNNTTFGSTGNASLTITGDSYTQSYSGTSTVDGNVFGSAAPPPEMYANIFTPSGGTFTTHSSFYGDVTMTVLPNGTFTMSAENIPSVNVSRATCSGTITPPGPNAQTITAGSTIFFRGGGSANCVTTLNRQP